MSTVSTESADDISPPAPCLLDTRPIFAANQTPCQAIDDAVEALLPGQTLVLLVPFEPFPLYAKLGAQGFACRAGQRPDGAWQVEFRRPG